MRIKIQAKDDSNDMSNTTYSRVRERLRSDILSNKFKPGGRLKIADLVKLYNVSQMPIREALQQLQGEGLIIIEQHRGAFVREIDKKYVSNFYDVRRVIEVFLTLESMSNMTEQSLAKLRKLNESYIKATRKNDFQQAIKINTEFHTTIYKLADNEEAIRLIGGHWQLLNNLRASFGFKENRYQEVIKEHEAILKALEEKDAKALEKAATLHCLNSKKDILEGMDELLGKEKL